MNNSQYTLPKYKLATIYQGLRRLVKLVRKMTFYLTITDRRIYGDRAILLASECLGEFIIAFDFQDERPQHYLKLVAKFHQLQCILEEINDANLIRKKPTVKKEDDPFTGTQTQLMRADKLVLAIFNEIGKIDDDISRWRRVAMHTAPANPCK